MNDEAEIHAPIERWAKEVGALPDLGATGEIRDWLWSDSLVHAHYRLSGPFANTDLALEQTKAAVARP